MLHRNGECIKCGSCCKFIGFEVTNSIGFDEWALARGLTVVYKGDSVKVMMENVCPNYVEGEGCILHNDRKPEVCKEFPWGSEYLLPGCGFTFTDKEVN